MTAGAEPPEIKFARLGRDHIAYAVIGDGPLDLLWMPGLGDVLDLRWDYPPYASFLRRLASFSRLIMFDRRGTGASDPVPLEALPTWENWADDALVVLDAARSERAAILGVTDAGPTAMLLTATHPDRTQALVLGNTTARAIADTDYPWGRPPSHGDELARLFEDIWGTEQMARLGNTDNLDDIALLRWAAKNGRLACSPREAATYVRYAAEVDVRHVLPLISVPTLVIQREKCPFYSLDDARYLTAHIPGARMVTVPGGDLFLITKPSSATLDHIEEFLTGANPRTGADRALAAILFTDIVGSTDQAAALGDRRWRALLESHDAVASSIIDQHRGRLVKLTGDGVLATFDGPGRAIRCALGLRDGLSTLGLKIRAGLHTGEVELRGDDIGGIGVHVAARVLDQAGPDEVIVPGAVPLLVAGSGIEFEDRGEHELKGVPGSWKLFAVEG
jgi:class 3 adenylate cyclase